MRPLGPQSPRISSHPDEDKNVSGKDKDTKVLDPSLFAVFQTGQSQFPKSWHSVHQKLSPALVPRTPSWQCILLRATEAELLGRKKGREEGRNI